ncbi:MAG: phospholipase D-like domain-containing protein [Burkholderiales bacterium]|nr:phospholipase D-like domain-containing protein [Burkholderiales bacterium]
MKSFLLSIFILISTYINAVTLDSIYQFLKTTDNGAYAKYDNITYQVPSLNQLSGESSWLIQTPELWGHSIAEYNYSLTHSGINQFDPQTNLPMCNSDADCGSLSHCQSAYFTTNSSHLCLLPEHQILNQIVANISNANYSVDITTLSNSKGIITTGLFTMAINQGLKNLAQRTINFNHSVTVRVLGGSGNPVFTSLLTYLHSLIQGIPSNNKLVVSVASMTSCFFSKPCANGSPKLDVSANHSKIVDVDSNQLIEGGENMWSNDYLESYPANDVSISLTGPVATTATIFVNNLWNNVRNNYSILGYNHCYTYSNGNISTTCAGDINPNNNSISNESGMMVQVMPLMNYGIGVISKDNNANQSMLAFVDAIYNAESSIKISQQAILYKFLMFPTVFYPLDTTDGNILQALAYAIHVNNVDVSIITSQLKSDNVIAYNSFSSLQNVHDAILDQLLLYHNETYFSAQQELTQKLHLASIDFNNSNDSKMNSHNKLLIVDNHLFYIGSYNIYLTYLQEFGVLVDSEEATTILNDNLWNPMWNNADKFSE